MPANPKGLTVHQVYAQIEKPDRASPAGRVSLGYYILQDNVLQMTTSEGVKIRDADGKVFEHALKPNDDPRVIAQRLTKTIRRMFRGETKSEERFGRPLKYPKTGIV